MTVKELFNVLDKGIAINVFEAGGGNLLFDSSRCNELGYSRKGYDDVKDCNVLQISNEDKGVVFIYVDMIH